MRRLNPILIAAFSLGSLTGFAAELTVEQARQQRFEAAHRPRRLVFHSDGVAMNPAHAYHEPTPSVITHLPGTQTDACTYSLIHQFPVVRLYRTKAGQEWPPGITERLFGKEGPDGLDDYIAFCRKHGYEAWWAMRTNDTHDATTDAHGEERWRSNLWKQTHPELLIGRRGDPHPPHGNTTAFDYAHSAVREKVVEVVSEVAQNYPVDGLLLDFFRHLPTFKTTALGAKEATDEERAALTALLRRLRDLRDQRGMKTGRPLLLAVRTPDTFEYSHALGLDLEQWMKEKLIDVWITPGYFRLTEWEDIVKLAHSHDMPVWAATDESRVKDREDKNSIEAYRARIMNMRRAGVDSVWIFNYFHFPKEAEFQLLNEAGSLDTLAFTDKLYVADDLGPKYAGFYLANGLSYVGRPKYFAPAEPEMLKPDQWYNIALRIGDDVKAATSHGFTAAITLKLQAAGVPEDFQIELNGQPLPRGSLQGEWIDYSVPPELVKLGINQVTLRRGNAIPGEMTLKDLQLSIRYRRASR
ncbi:MAG: hypothetical protein ACO1TE_05840 [Prosthecobacter sp.]